MSFEGNIYIGRELRAELEQVLGEGETVISFVEQAIRSELKYRKAHAEFLARGERARQEYLRTGQARPAGEVFDQIQKRIDERRQELLTRPQVTGGS